MALSDIAKEVLNVVRQAREEEIDVEAISKKSGYERWHVIPALKELADSGYGSFIVGRRGFESRFVKSGVLLRGEAAPGTAQATAEQVYLLTRDIPVQIRVPADLTKAEIAKITRWLAALSPEE